MPFYPVAKGHRTGIFDTWAQCEIHVKGYSGAKHRKFSTRGEAERYIASAPSNVIPNQAGGNSSNLKWGKCENQFSAQTNAFNATDRNTTMTAMPSKDSDDACIYIAKNSLVSTEEKLAAKYGVALNERTNNNSKKGKKEKSFTSTEHVIIIDDDDDDDDGFDGDDEELLLALSAIEEYPENFGNLRGRTKNHDKNASRKRKVISHCDTVSKQAKTLKHNFYSFEINSDGYINVYIAGYGENIGSWNGIAGYGVYFGRQHPLNVTKASAGRITRNVGDIEAAVRALNIAKDNDITRLCVITGSEFLLNAVMSWLHFWRIQGWRTKTGTVVQNRKELEKLDNLIRDDSLNIEWKNGRGVPKFANGINEAFVLARLWL